MQIGRYCWTFCAEGTLASAETNPVTACEGQGAPFSSDWIKRTKSSTEHGGMFNMSLFEIPSGPTAANLRLEATALVNILAVMGGKLACLSGSACCMKPTMASQ